MDAAAQQMESTKSTATSAVLEKVTAAATALKAALSDRLQHAVSAFHDTLESRKYYAAEALRLSQLPPRAKETGRVAALLLCSTSSRVIQIREGLNHFKCDEKGIHSSTREEYLQSAGSIFELKVEGDHLQAWTASSTQAMQAATNEVMAVLNGSFFVKVIPFELRGSEQ